MVWYTNEAHNLLSQWWSTGKRVSYLISGPLRNIVAA